MMNELREAIREAIRKHRETYGCTTFEAIECLTAVINEIVRIAQGALEGDLKIKPEDFTEQGDHIDD